METQRIDWTSLQHTHGPVPWDAIRAAVEALAANPELLDEILARFSLITSDPYVIPTFEYCYIPYIAAETAGRLPPASAEKIHRWLLDELITAGDLDDDNQMEFFMYCCKSQGPAILPALFDVMNDDDFDTHTSAWFHIWGIVEVVRDSTNEEIREKFADLAMRTLRQAIDGEISYGEGIHAAHTVASLKHAPAIPLLEKLIASTAGKAWDHRMSHADYVEGLEILQGSEPDFPIDRRNLIDEVEDGKDVLERWYAERPADWNSYDFEDEDIDNDDVNDDEFDDDDFDDDEDDIVIDLGGLGVPPMLESATPYFTEPIRNKEPKVGRNDPCPCGSGKKYKKCCGG